MKLGLLMCTKFTESISINAEMVMNANTHGEARFQFPNVMVKLGDFFAPMVEPKLFPNFTFKPILALSWFKKCP